MRKFLASLTIILLANAPAHSAPTSKIAQSCNTKSCLVNFHGEIEPGDAKVLESAIRNAPFRVESLTITSPGGDPFEALKMSAILNWYFIMLATGLRNGAGQLEQLGGGDCASACALMFLTSDQRFGTEVFLHRPTFTPESFRAIPDDLASAAYNAKTIRLENELRIRGVANTLIEQMMSIPSDTVQQLNKDFPDRSPWMQEWLASKCGGETKAETAMLNRFEATGDTAVAFMPVGEVIRCQSAAIIAAQSHSQRIR